MKTLRGAGYLIFTFGLLGYAQPAGYPTRTIHEAIDETKLVRLDGNTRPEANARNDRGMVPDDFRLSHMLLQLKRSPAREAALRQYIDELHDSKSPSYHEWLSPEQFAEHYGVAADDVAAVTGWLTSHGFTVEGIPASGLAVDFSGTAGEVRTAFHTEIHNLDVNGVKHFANMGDPRIPAALEPAVAGIVSLHNFHPKPLLAPVLSPRGNYTFTNSSGTFQAVVPGDIATIYNLAPLFASGVTGKGESIMVVEDTYLYSTDDWTTFRKTFGLAKPYPDGTLSQVSPQGAIRCINPGFQGNPKDPGYGDDSEAAIDVEWSSATAPNAAIILAACTDTATTFGGLIAIENTLNGPQANIPSIISVSYGEAEAANGAAANLAYNNAYQQAVAEGVSVFVASGDEGAASADNGDVSTLGISISGFTSTEYNVSVGGLDFGYAPNNVPASTYWRSANSPTYSSALSYIQEVPWNDSCAGGLIAGYLGTTPLGLCNDREVTSPNGPLNALLNAVAGSGGPSGCATGTPPPSGTVGGSCKGYPKPPYQKVLGNPNDGVRDIPDLSLFASNGFWGSYYVTCWSDPNTAAAVGGGFTCTGAPSTWAGFGGTSVSTVVMAGVQALVNQKTGSRWGNPNTVYYALAAAEYGVFGSQRCNSNTVTKFSNSCIFYDITQGDNDVACEADRYGTFTNCYRTQTRYGVLSTSNMSDQPAYRAGAGWDFTSGIGSVNAYNLVMSWPYR
ncbi:MAG: protease pro-enzyme activation domain-containing protein [Bryobacteraceae bacterium]